MKTPLFLPATREEMTARGWDYVDVVLVTGDAYIDHPSFGVALIGRWLEANDYRVAILAQPHHDTFEDFKIFGRPRLFFGITAGNLDSIVANYSANGKVRDVDDFSPDGNPYFGLQQDKAARRRPDRATIRYTNLAKAAYTDIPVVLGGLEASLRRFVHYDYQQHKIRASILTDSKADILVYGMGEKAIITIANCLQSEKKPANIPSTCERLTEKDLTAERYREGAEILPSLQEIQKDPRIFLHAELLIDKNARSASPKALLQKQQALWMMQHVPAGPLTTQEMDALYALPFVRAPHPKEGLVPAYKMIRHSITTVRGCYGNCSFCAITRHQGSVAVSRSIDSITREAKRIAVMPDFKGTISDLGGPTANMFATGCSKESCNRHDCLYPKICQHLQIDESAFLEMLENVESIKNIKHVYVSSGLRMELLLRTPALLRRLLAKHIPGAMKIAPEHTDKGILRLMHKHQPELLEQFLTRCRNLASKMQKEVFFTPYIISSHPGCKVHHMKQVASKAKSLNLTIRQLQDFTPTPGTISTAMYVSGLDRDTKKPIHVPRNATERLAQRNTLQDAAIHKKSMCRKK